MIINVLLLSVLFSSLFLGGLIFFKNTKAPANFYYFLFSIFLALWSFGMWMYAKDPIDYNRILLWSRILHAAGLLVANTLLFFAIVFPKNQRVPVKYLFISIPTLILCYITLFTDLVIKTVNFLPGNRQLEYSTLYYLYFGLFVTYMLSALIILIRKYIVSSGIEKQQIKYISWSITVASTISFVINMVLPAFGNFVAAWTGPLVIFIILAAIGYAITKHHLFDMKVIVSEASVVIVGFAAFSQILLSTNTTEFFLRAIIFLIIIFGGFLLIKSVQHEISQKEKIQKLATDLEKANEHLKELDKLKDDFLSMASHELNTPIAAIEGYLSMVLVEGMGGKIPDKARGYLDTVFTSAQRLAHMVKDLLNVSRIESNRIHIIWEQKPIEDVIKQAVTEVMSKAREAKHTLTFEEPKKTMPKTWFDVTRITEILINMLGNSIKYTDPGGKITVRCHCDDDKIVVEVEDNGKGIPKERAKAVFEKFSQVDVMKDEVKGTGLGMYIAQKFIELHHGKIWFHSDGEGKGTTFFFSLPVLKEKPFDEHEGEDAVLH